MDKKTFTGPELAQAILKRKFKEGTKFRDELGTSYQLKLDKRNNLKGNLILFSDDFKTEICGKKLIYFKFTLIEQPKLYYFNQVIKLRKRIKINDWTNFHTLQEVLQILACASDTVDTAEIIEALTKKVWEIEQ